MKKEVKKQSKKSKAKIDSLIYWLVQVAFAVFTAAGIYHYLEPVDPILSLPLTGMLVSLLFYVSVKNR